MIEAELGDAFKVTAGGVDIEVKPAVKPPLGRGVMAPIFIGCVPT